MSETPVAFAGAGRASTETAIAFAGAKWAFSVQFSGAEVMPVSMVAVWGRALVMVVSRWPASVAVEVSLVASSPHGCVLSAKKFALRAHNGPKLAVYGVLGEFFRGPAVVGSRGASCVAPRPW